MADHPRAAGPSIRGYAYQFDMSVLMILRASNSATLTIEGFEDLDIDSAGENEFVQCKYHQGRKYSLAGLRDPIVPMLDAFKAGTRGRFTLYVHYGDATDLPTSLTRNDLKQALTLKRKSGEVIEHFAGMSDDLIDEFASSLSIKAGEPYQDQQAQVVEELVSALSCSIDDARDLHYADAVSIVAALAMQDNDADRRITRPTFLEQLDKRPTMFTRWHREYVGHQRFMATLRRRLQSAGLLRPTKRRLIVMPTPSGSTQADLLSTAGLIRDLSTIGFGRGKLDTTRPWTVAVEATSDELTALKEELLSEDLAFNDGYETIRFNPSIFSADPIINTSSRSRLISKASFGVRVVSVDTYKAHQNAITAPHVVISFGSTTPQELDPAGEAQTLHLSGFSNEDAARLLKGSS
jgi:hypothetical protein